MDLWRTLELKMKIINKKINEITPYKLNAKNHPESQILGIVESIKRFGFTQPIVVDKKNEIIIGHGRIEAAKKLDLKEVPVVVMDSLTEVEIKALRLIDNRIAETGWDSEMLKIDLDGINFEFGAFNINFDDILSLENKVPGSFDEDKEDDVPDIGKVAKTKSGDVYILGEHRLMCGDSCDEASINKLVQSKVDMVFTDPPYNLDYDFSKNGMVQTGQRKERFGKILNDQMSKEDFDKFIEKVFKNLMEKMNDGASFYISGRRESTQIFNRLLDGQGFHIQSWIIWVKENFNISRLDYHPKHEIISYGWKKEKAHSWYSDRSQVDVVNFSRKKDGKTIHPTQKPVSLIEYFLKNSSKPGDLILDVFGGSGSTMIACEKTNRKARTMELDPNYCDVIVQRWENITGKEAVLEK